MHELVESAIDLFRNRQASANIDVEREYEPVAQVMCSSEEIRQVAAALVSNSRDAMLSGGKLRVRIRAGRAWQNGGRAGVRVTMGPESEIGDQRSGNKNCGWLEMAALMRGLFAARQ